MNIFEINIRNNREVFKPGETIEGEIKWQLVKNPKELELTLYWHTQGKGTEDIGITETLKFDNPGSFGSDNFQFTLPKGPYSFSGKLISIIWTLELTASKIKETCCKNIIISPNENEIVYTETHSADDDLANNSFLKKLKGKFKPQTIDN
jgi:hypothetical protein